MSESMYERIGGEAAIMAASEILYRRLLDDPLTSPFFDGLDVDAQVRKQVGFLSWALGGPVEFRGRDLGAAHANLVARGLDDRHFDAVARHLKAALEELAVEPGLVREVIATTDSLRDQVLGRG